MSTSTYNLAAANVLVAEQNMSLRTMLRGVFRELGVSHTTVVATAPEAFDAFVAGAYDLVLIDWAPSFDGIGLLQKIRSDPKSPSPFVPVIVMTANTERHHICTARDAGMTEYLAKPLSAALIYRRICAVIESNRPFVRANRFFGPDRRRKKVSVSGNRRDAGAQAKAAHKAVVGG